MHSFTRPSFVSFKNKRFYYFFQRKNNQLSVLIPSLRALGNIVTGNDAQTNVKLSQSMNV